MLNIFKHPLNKESVDSWCKILDDIAKVAILAIPVVLYSGNEISYKFTNSIFLVISAYCCLMGANIMRRNKEKLTTPKE